MIATNITKIDKEKALSDLVKRTRRQYISKAILIPIILLSGLGILISGIINEDNNYVSVGIVFFIIGLGYFITSLISFIKIPKKVYEQNKIVCELGMTYDYKFKEQSMIVTCIQGNKSNKLEYKYDSIKKVLEYQDRYEIALKENFILFIYKNGFPDNMEKFFIKNLALNKKIIRNKKD